LILATQPIRVLLVDDHRSVLQRGATVFRTTTGIEYRHLHIRRSDVQAAVTALKSLCLTTTPYTDCRKEALGCFRSSVCADRSGLATEGRGAFFLATAPGKRSRRL
jgi:hypothetical protein